MISQLYPKYYAGITAAPACYAEERPLEKFRKCGKWEGNEELDVLDSQLAVLSRADNELPDVGSETPVRKGGNTLPEISGGKDDFRLDYNSSFTIGLETEGREKELKEYGEKRSDGNNLDWTAPGRPYFRCERPDRPKFCFPGTAADCDPWWPSWRS